MARADLLLLSSRWEGMPYVVLEAMARGMPVVATPVDGAREVIVPGKTGFLSPTVDARGVAEALAAALSKSPEEWVQMGRAGQQRVAEHYSLESMVRGLDAVYAELL
jgi:glycosyltransferase involved in cell wall biosynthesis